MVNSPESIIAGRPVFLRIRYLHQGPGLVRGASLRFGYNINDGAGCVQTDDPDAFNYLQAETSGKAVIMLSGFSHRRSITFYQGTGVCNLMIFEINIVSGTLKNGDTIDFVFGTEGSGKGGFIVGKGCDSPWRLFYHIDPSNLFPLKSLHSDAPNYQQYLSSDGSKVPPWQPCGIEIEVLPAAPESVDLSLPSLIDAETTAMMRLVVYDKYFNHLKNFNGHIQLLNSETDRVKFTDQSFSTGDRGYVKIPVKFGSPGPAKVLKFLAEGLGIFTANPVKITKKPENRIFWGDLHGHSCLSDGGCRGPEDFFAYARDIRGLDFAALADHSFGLAVRGHWQRLLDTVKQFSASQDFVPILGYEIMFISPFGHRNVYFPELEGKILMADYQSGSGGSFDGEQIEAYKHIWDPEITKTATPEETINALETTEFIWTVHHCGNIAEVDKKDLTLYEICSEWGISEECFCKNTSSTPAGEIFKKGFSLGLTGGSDDHQAKAGFRGRGRVDRSPLSYPSGLTALLCPALNRREIYDALKSKHCYATTGARTLLEPKVEYVGKNLRVQLGITGTNDLERAWIFKNGQQIFHTFFRQDNVGIINWEDENFALEDNCYIRIRQVDGEIAWINPIPFLKRD